MEKNERLAWRTKPRTYCFSSCPKRHCKRETLPNCKLKKQLFRPRKVVFSFSLPDTLGSRHEAFQAPFPAAQSATAKGDPSKLQIKKTTFQAPKSCFFIFPSTDTLGSRHEAFQVPFPAAQSATAKGDPSNCKLKTTFRAPKSCFFQKFEPSTCFILTHRLKKKQLFGLRKVVFFKSGFERPKCFILATCPLDLVKKVDISRF